MGRYRTKSGEANVNVITCDATETHLSFIILENICVCAVIKKYCRLQFIDKQTLLVVVNQVDF